VRLTFCDVGSNSHEVLEFYREYAFDKIQGLFKDFGKLGVMLRSNSINSCCLYLRIGHWHFQKFSSPFPIFRKRGPV
jgi:hypothetical protein